MINFIFWLSFIPSTTLALNGLESECFDIESQAQQYVIVQKIDAHLYEVASAYNPSMRWVLKTKRATFKRPGKPVGIRIRNMAKSIQVETSNGFTRSYGTFEECGLVDMPSPAIYPPNVSPRDLIKGK